MVSVHEWPIYWYQPQKSHIGQSLLRGLGNLCSSVAYINFLFFNTILCSLRSSVANNGMNAVLNNIITCFALQYTEEKLGSAEKTEYDANFENLLLRYDKTKHWTERIKSQTEAFMQPNPSKLFWISQCFNFLQWFACDGEE